jgi:hypothetical protein
LATNGFDIIGGGIFNMPHHLALGIQGNMCLEFCCDCQPI